MPVQAVVVAAAIAVALSPLVRLLWRSRWRGGKALADHVEARPREPHGVDQCLRFWRTPDPWLGVALLGLLGDRADLYVAKTRAKERIVRDRFLVKAGGDADGAGKMHAEHLAGQTWRRHVPERAEQSLPAVGAAKVGHGHMMGTLGLEPKECPLHGPVHSGSTADSHLASAFCQACQPPLGIDLSGEPGFCFLEGARMDDPAAAGPSGWRDDDVQQLVVHHVIKHEFGNGWIIEDTADDDAVVIRILVAKAPTAAGLAPAQFRRMVERQIHGQADPQVGFQQTVVVADRIDVFAAAAPSTCRAPVGHLVQEGLVCGAVAWIHAAFRHPSQTRQQDPRDAADRLVGRIQKMIAQAKVQPTTPFADGAFGRDVRVELDPAWWHGTPDHAFMDRLEQGDQVGSRRRFHRCRESDPWL